MKICHVNMRMCVYTFELYMHQNLDHMTHMYIHAQLNGPWSNQTKARFRPIDILVNIQDSLRKSTYCRAAETSSYSCSSLSWVCRRTLDINLRREGCALPKRITKGFQISSCEINSLPNETWTLFNSNYI